MKRKILLSVVLLLLSSFSLIAFAQEAELSLYSKLTAVIEKKEPEWKLHRKAIMPNQVVIQWASETGRANIAVALLASEATAEKAFRSKVNQLENIPESKISKVELKDFGDESYILKTYGVSGTDVIFRQGVYVVQVFGPSEGVAKRFSKYIADLLRSANNPANLSAG